MSGQSADRLWLWLWLELPDDEVPDCVVDEPPPAALAIAAPPPAMTPTAARRASPVRNRFCIATTSFRSLASTRRSEPAAAKSGLAAA
jgi:hypothetical protein